MSQRKPARVLVVDDAPDNLDLLCDVLGLDGHEVVTARGGEAALALARELRPDAAVLDVEMPGMDGYELCQRLRETLGCLELPIIFLTARAATDDAVRGLETGACDYVTKPFDARALRARLRAALRDHYEHEVGVAHAKSVVRRLSGGVGHGEPAGTGINPGSGGGA